jgi:Rrf2 family nitric oxide-sensitive transcriptional repressor
MSIIRVWHKSKIGNICYWMPWMTGWEGTVRLTIYTDYSLRLLMYLAVREGRLVTIGEVADAYGIAKNHLTKVVHQLGVAGDIETVRGKGGGIRLKNSAESINLGAVIRRTEPDLALVPCFDSVDACAIGKACLLQATLHDALAAFLAVLDRTTLADVVAPRRKLAALLGLRPTKASRGRATATQRAL